MFFVTIRPCLEALRTTDVKMPEKTPQKISAWQYASEGTQLAVTLLLGVFVGYKLDQHWGTSPRFYWPGPHWDLSQGCTTSFAVFSKSRDTRNSRRVADCACAINIVDGLSPLVVVTFLFLLGLGRWRFVSFWRICPYGVCRSLAHRASAGCNNAEHGTGHNLITCRRVVDIFKAEAQIGKWIFYIFSNIIFWINLSQKA